MQCGILLFFLRQVHVVASLPCYSPKNVNQQRGSGVFDRSIRGLMKLNALGYGKPGSGLKLDLVYNPVGGFLPPEQVRDNVSYIINSPSCGLTSRFFYSCNSVSSAMLFVVEPC